MIGGCAPAGSNGGNQTPAAPAPIIVQQEVPGAYEEVWEEPMVDTIDVPPGVDPEGIYYRPGHQEVVEIRQGRWQYYNKDKD